MKKTLSVCSFFVCFLFIWGQSSKFFPVNEVENTVNAPAWYVLVAFVIPFFIARIIWKGSIKKGLKFKEDPICLAHSEEKFKIPSSKKKRNALAVRLTLDMQAKMQQANESQSIVKFIELYDEMLISAEKLSKLSGKVTSVNGPLISNYLKLERDFQGDLQSTVDRLGDAIIALKKGELKYEPDIVKKKLLEYGVDINTAIPRADEETRKKMRIKYNFVCRECNQANLLEDTLDSEVQELKVYGITAVQKPFVESELKKIDAMDGHDFEYWCADVLKKCGYENVEVTRGSGDQGVDVLAKKDGVQYAIQCKCYSANLGNKPVQEVNTGKLIYHCHIGIVMTNRYFTEGAHQAADASGVLLWDRGKIVELLKNIEQQEG